MLSGSGLALVGSMVAATLAFAMGLVWLSDRSQKAVGWIAMALALGGIAAALSAAPDVVPSLRSGLIADIAIALCLGVMWHGFAVFEHRQPKLWATLGGALLWCVLAFVPTLVGHHTPLVVMQAAMVTAYAWAVAAGLIHGGREEPLPARWAAATLMIFHGGLALMRIPMTYFYDVSPQDFAVEDSLFALEGTLFAACVAIAMLALATQRASARYRKAAETDSLTGIANRHMFMRHVDPMVRRATDKGVLILLDLDHFKVINDMYGHVQGDLALIAFADTIKGEVSEPDQLGRIEGKQFALFMPDVTLDIGIHVAEYLRRKTEAVRLDINDMRIPLTMSAGVAAVADTGPDLDALRAAAEIALRDSKSGGRNRVTPFSKVLKVRELARKGGLKAVS
ncbi:GGDEF domain-containing protein [Oryzibacter oryziterrae]|uniref:GGDEF domain-containing protein n=1 Tax=Oryzibacter oryziterrae TaxID=2766474 RepID=UPI001F15B314|nr:GGDEF domain-containing protein [Oryzibacter oryziterrae]